MFAIILAIIILALAIVSFCLCHYFFENTYSSLDILFLILGFVLLIAFIFPAFSAVDYIDYTINPIARVQEVELKRESYIELLNKYEILSMNDLTASTSYQELYEKICEFNSEVYRAQEHKDNIFMASFLYDPAYVDIEPIDIN